nr:replication initiation protein RepC [Seohaeicola saemankumensis]
MIATAFHIPFEAASATVAAILQRVDEIRTPGGYLRALTAKARHNGFSPAPMILALLQPDGRA